MMPLRKNTTVETKAKKHRGFLKKSRAEDGAATVEFAILFPLAASFFLASAEVAVHMAYQAFLDRGVDLAMRSIRINQMINPTNDLLSDKICDSAGLLLTNCDTKMAVEMVRVTAGTAPGFHSNVAQCVTRDPDGNLVPASSLQLNSAAANDVILVRVCYKMDPFFPSTAFGRELDENGNYNIQALASFTVEPR